MTDDEVFGAITAQRLALIDCLESLEAAQWDTASLCAGWRVRDVVGHLVSILDLPLHRGKAQGFIPAMRTAGLRFAATDLDWAVGEGPVVEGAAANRYASGESSAHRQNISTRVF